jgi:outer membrane lipoprotein-sorting protein
MKKLWLLFCLLLLILPACTKAGTPNTTEQPTTTASEIFEALETTETASSNGEESSDKKLGEALNYVMGTSDRSSVYQSYHLDLDMTIPTASDDMKSVISQQTKISADVEGSKIHIFSTDLNTGETKEGYIVGDNEYKMINGTPQATLGQIGVSWAFWPLKVVYAYSTATNWANKIRTEDMSGRQADVYSLDTTSPEATSVLEGMRAIGFDVLTSATGTLWIDQETGGMLKLDMNFTRNEYDNDGNVIGSGNGVINLQISQVNQVTITPPQ